MKLTIAERKIVEEICRNIQADYLKKWTINELSIQYRISKNKLANGIKIVQGCTFAQYLLEVQMYRAKEKIKQGKNILEVTIEFGYSSVFNFNRAFRKVFPKPPSAYLPVENRERRL